MAGGPYLTPRGVITGPRARDAVTAGLAWPLLGQAAAFTAIDVTTVQDGSVSTALMSRGAYDNALVCASPMTSRSMDAALAALSAPRSAFAGLALSQSRIMGIVNVTPDSFSDGGVFRDPAAAIAHGIALAESGADIIDVGGESTRPGAESVAPEEESRRVLPVVKALVARGLCVSIDTRRASVMAEAIAAGARIVNDVTALAGDAESLKVVAASSAAVILMHMKGEPRTMQDAPHYVWAPGEVFDVLQARVTACVAAGIARDRLAVDPGIGFGKTDVHAVAIYEYLGLLHGLGCALAIGVSRKGFIGRFSRNEAATDRLPGSLAAALRATEQGAQIIRVHDVAETRQALTVAGRLGGAGWVGA